MTLIKQRQSKSSIHSGNVQKERERGDEKTQMMDEKHPARADEAASDMRCDLPFKGSKVR